MAGRRRAAGGAAVAALTAVLALAAGPPPAAAGTTPTPAPSPTEDCGAATDGAVSLGDVDRDCDGTLLLEEQGQPTSIRRTLERPDPEVTDDQTVEDRFEPAEFVRGRLVSFDTESEQGGTIRDDGPLVYTPPPGFVGTDRWTFLYDDGEWVREAEVVVEVVVAEEGTEPAASPATPSATPSPEQTQDAAERALTDSSLLDADDGDRWDPPYLVWLTMLAGVLLGIALLWWLFLEVRIQDRIR